jgi:uncharacterized protein (TIGR02118 family)
MVKLVALYKKPADPADFDRQYFEEHMPLAAKMPGLRRCEVSRITGTPMGESEYYMMAEMYFDDMEALKAAMSSPEGRASAKNLMGFAKDIVSMVFAEVEKVPAGIGG